MIVLKDNLVRMANNNVVIGMGIKGRHKMAPAVENLHTAVQKINLANNSLARGSGSIVGQATAIKRKPISFL